MRRLLLLGPLALLVHAGCGGEVANRYNGATIGKPCVPALESDPLFTAFGVGEVNIELPNPTADPGQIVCLANHFEGRATCPYGQDSAGIPPAGASACKTPDGHAVVGDVANDPKSGAIVRAQCTDRRAADVVTWSCRCANAAGKTDDGAQYCSCGDGLACVQLVVALPGDTASGAYCIKAGTEYASETACAATCDPIAHPCP